MYEKNIMLSITWLLISTAFSPVANAASTTGTLTVQATISEACSVTSGDKALIDFGTIYVTNKMRTAQTTDATGIAVQCSEGVQYLIYLSQGLHQLNAGEVDNRRMSFNEKYIPYELYQDSAFNTEWGSVESKKNFLSATGDGTIQKYPVYAKIYNQQTPPAGTYSDTVTIQVNY